MGKIVKVDAPKKHRLFKLSDGDIVYIIDRNFEFENNLLYEVKSWGFDGFFNEKWKRTGNVYTPQEINEWVKEH